ncbi:MAG: ACP S-malonyltransferase [Thermoleophilaceae bacterium]
MGDPRATTTAVLFPGQGSHSDDMRDLVAERRPDLLELAREACGRDPFEHLDRGTRYQQPAILCASLAAWETVRSERPALLAGHSLGEITALTAAGALAEADAVRLVAVRGRAMEAADGRGEATGMLAVRTDLAIGAAVAARAGASVANENSPRQVVLAGSLAALERAETDLTARGLRAKRLPVSGAFHSPAMAAAERPLRAELDGIRFQQPRVPVLSCVTAAPFTDPRAELVAALTRPVRWVAVLQALERRGARRFVEAGPGKVLTGLVRRTLDGVEAVAPDAEAASHA